MQQGLAAEITGTKNQLREVGADLDAVSKKIGRMQARIDKVKAAYLDLVRPAKAMDTELAGSSAQEAAKRLELG